MWDQEKVHLQLFERLTKERRVRPTALIPLWEIAGYVLGILVFIIIVVLMIKINRGRDSITRKGSCYGMYCSSGRSHRRALQ